LRITFLSPRSNLSGGLRVIATYARMLHERGHQVTIVTPGPESRGRKERLQAATKGDFSPVKTEPGHFDTLPFKIHETRRPDYRVEPEELPDADILVATWWEAAFPVASMHPEKGKQFYLIQHHEVHKFLPWQISRATYYLPIKPIVISNWLNQILRHEYGRTDAILVPNGIDLTQFHASPRDKAKRPTIGFMYSPWSMKGSDTVLETVQILKQKVPDLEVIAFGANPPTQKMPLPDGTVFHHRPEQSRIRDIYAACDVFLCASTSEGFFLPLLEAMACRCPLVSTRVGAAEDLIIEGTTGYLANIGDAAALADGAQKILSLTAPEWRKMSDACLQTAQSHSWDKACDRLEQCFEDELAAAQKS
jgi:glycosyltransferase involved in cell wall biosynthesis